MSENTAISFYTDMMIVEEVLGNKSLYKKADASGLMAGLVSKIKDYVQAHLKPNDRLGSIINILAPGLISATLKSMGFGWIGVLFGMAASTLHLDINSVLQTIWTDIKGLIGEDKQTTSSQVDAVVHSAVQSNLGTSQAIQPKLTFDQNLRAAKLVRLSMEDFDRQTLSLSSAPISITASSKTANILTQVLSWIFKVALSAAGFLVAGDVVNKFVGRPNALDHTYQAGSETASPAQSSLPTSTQTKFPLKSDSPIPFMLPIQNTPENIDSTIINFAKSVYSGLDGKEEQIKALPGFLAAQDKIKYYNSTTQGNNAIYFPKEFTSKKQLADLFIDDLAKAS